MNMQATFQELVADTAPATLREAALDFIVRRDAARAFSDTPIPTDRAAEDRWCDRSSALDGAEWDARDVLYAAFARYGIDRDLADNLGIIL